MFELPRQVRVTFRRFIGGNAGKRSLKPHLKVPSEGRGQRFESSWVRQFSAIFENVTATALVLRFGLRFDVPAPLLNCSRFSSGGVNA
jgi:hypothetical protein